MATKATKADIKKIEKLTKMALAGKPWKIDYTTAIAPNGDFVVHDRGEVVGRVLAKDWR
jgi:hypothetical protein